MEKLIPCSDLDHNPGRYPSCTLKTVPGTDIQYFQRPPQDYDITRDVQFCGKGRGRINSILNCYDGSMHCYNGVKT